MAKKLGIEIAVLLCVLFNPFRDTASASESLILGCGAAGKDADGRVWDSDEKYLAPGTNSAALRANYQDPSLLSDTPYMTSRVFPANATYRLPGKAGHRYWLRLHFYPAIYGTNDAETSFFSVVADGTVLLRNFSAAITCRALTQAYLVREYALAPLAGDTLSLTFEPASGDTGFAFLNGLELVPLSDDVFGSSVGVVGFSDQTVDAATANMQTVHRLNVGGQYISPANDSEGLARAWYDDFPYLYGASSGVTNEAGPNTKIDYGEFPSYIAPADVYRTARSMGNSKEVNKNYNLTWVLQQIDPNFMYLVRLHFCDFHYSKPNEVVFNVYLNNKTAQSGADVIGWSGGRAVPTYKDFAVFVSKGKDAPPEEEKELWLAVNPATETKPEFYDAMLNGVEVFKLESSRSLAGPNPRPSAMLEKNEQDQKKFTAAKPSSSKHAQVIGGAAGGAAAFGIVAALCVAVYHRKRRSSGTESHTSSWLPVYGNSHTTGSKSAISGKSTASSHLSATAQGRCRRFTFAEMKKATRSFDESNVVGVGGFGKVYKATIDGGIKVAIKRSNPSSEQGVHEFQTEIEMLSELRHKHLVSLIGFCDDGEEMCLVYDYMARGTLREHLYRNNKPTDSLTWKQRLELCIGAAKGLHYLHTGAKWTIIHRDVKTTNILLDENWVAKVSDFGLSKTGPDLSTGHVSTVVKGSFGYLDPEYFKRQQLTEKSDVYSFGVVLFEALCARPALNPNLPKEQVSLADWALHCHRKGTLGDIIDPSLRGKVDPESVKKFADTAQKCLSEHGIDRPTLNDILWNLEFALQLQENMDGTGVGTGIADPNNTVQAHYAKLSLGSDSDLGTDDSGNHNTTAVFSQIVNPKGR